jgi:hypothetical protein
MGKLTERALEMKRVVEEYGKSGLRRREFCERRGMALTTFDYWRRELAARPKLVKVEVSSGPVGQFTLMLANGRRIESSWRLGEEELARLIRIAERA